MDQLILENETLRNELHELSLATIAKEKRFCLSAAEAMTMSDDELLKVKQHLTKSFEVIRLLEDRPDFCVVCTEQKRTVLYLPCKHCVTCSNCASFMEECPVCRCPIADKMNIFL